MGTKAETMEWYYNTVGRYEDINNSRWFQALIKDASRNSERNGNRIYIYFDTEELANKCCEEAERRNIKYMSPMHQLFPEEYRVDILMNWKKRIPSRIRCKEEQILND